MLGYVTPFDGDESEELNDISEDTTADSLNPATGPTCWTNTY